MALCQGLDITGGNSAGLRVYFCLIQTLDSAPHHPGALRPLHLHESPEPQLGWEGCTANHLKRPGKHPQTGEGPAPLDRDGGGGCCWKMEILGQGLQHHREEAGEEMH